MQVYNALQLKKGAKTEHNRLGSITQPLQFIPKKEKDDKWAAWNLDWLEWNGLKQIKRNARRRNHSQDLLLSRSYDDWY